MNPGMKYSLSDFDFELPDELIAQTPSSERGSSRLFVLKRQSGEHIHSLFSKLPDFLNSGDLLVFNNSRVIPARIYFLRPTGSRVEFVLARRLDAMRWYAISNRTARLKQGEVLCAAADDSVKITVRGRSGEYLEIETEREFTDDLLGTIGKIPLPPYIRREPSEEDYARYQTVYAAKPGAVAAPTAGLHFTEEILERIRAKGVRTVFVTLDVSWGTFQPVRTESIEEHHMHSERFELSPEAAAEINAAREDGRRVIAVGTTSLRVLESSFDGCKNIPGCGDTDIFIYPPRKVLSADAMITNFHTPRSTLLMLVSAFAGYDTIMNAYNGAVRERYRFFSYGDSMFIC
ncbi:MAG: tRNA preQ1(34) S-adenosylmethionine ribosyltransferase-isomerase QueA [Spirochaetota bacterium]